MNFQLQERELRLARGSYVGFRKAIYVFAKSKKSIFFEKNEHILSDMVMDHINNEDDDFSKVEIKELDKIVKTAQMTIIEVVSKII